MKIDKEKVVGEIKNKVSIDVDLTLWSAIKIRIAGIYNLIKESTKYSKDIINNEAGK